MKIGEEFNFYAFISTSFGSPIGHNKNYIFSIEIPIGVRILLLSIEQQEILLLPGILKKIQDSYTENGYDCICKFKYIPYINKNLEMIMAQKFKLSNRPVSPSNSSGYNSSYSESSNQPSAWYNGTPENLSSPELVKRYSNPKKRSATYNSNQKPVDVKVPDSWNN
jgi:hypothetical protein